LFTYEYQLDKEQCNYYPDHSNSTALDAVTVECSPTQPGHHPCVGALNTDDVLATAWEEMASFA